LAIASAIAPEFKLEVARRVEDLNAIVECVSNVDILAICGYAFRRTKLAVAGAIASEREL